MRIVLQDIHKHYGPVKANNGVSFTVEGGTIHGILGENGAGKSTLMKILSGFIGRTSGTILLDDVEVELSTPAEASEHGIGMLYQDPLDFPPLSVLENFMMGQARGFFKQEKKFADRLREMASDFNFSLKLDAPVKSLTVGERQQLEILRLLELGIRVLILDEPTTGISVAQKDILFNALRKLASEGKTVIVVSHKLEDVEALCDKVTVLRLGKTIGDMPAPFETDGLLEMMFGKKIEPPAFCDAVAGKEILTMRGISASGGRTGLNDCNVAIRRGEVIGLAGLEGSGQGLFLRVAAGVKKPSKGDISLNGRDMGRGNYHRFQKEGVMFLPTNRLEEGLISGLTISEHFCVKDKTSRFFLDRRRSETTAQSRISEFRIKGSFETQAQDLSGGNQQRLLLSFLPADPTLLLLENPTRGLDMESVNWVWAHLRKYCDRKTSIVFSSSELDEILMVADRVLIFFDGFIIKDVRTDRTDSTDLGRAIAGKTK